MSRGPIRKRPRSSAAPAPTPREETDLQGVIGIPIYGVDPSSRSIAVVQLVNDPTSFTDMLISVRAIKRQLVPVKMSPVDISHACMAAYMFGLTFKDKAMVFLEAPVSYGAGRGHATIMQSRVSGALLAALKTRDAVVYDVAVTEWKKEVVGAGNATKQQVAERISSLWPSAVSSLGGDQDLIDAFAIAIFGLRRLRVAADQSD